MSSSQLTFTFFRGVGSTSNQSSTIHYDPLLYTMIHYYALFSSIIIYYHLLPSILIHDYHLLWSTIIFYPLLSSIIMYYHLYYLCSSKTSNCCVFWPRPRSSEADWCPSCCRSWCDIDNVRRWRRRLQRKNPRAKLENPSFFHRNISKIIIFVYFWSSVSAVASYVNPR